MISKRQKSVAGIYAAALVASAVSCFLYPDTWTLPLPLAAAFGPFLAIRLGIAAGILPLVLSLGLAVPFISKRTTGRVALLAVAVLLWLITGFSVGSLLYA